MNDLVHIKEEANLKKKAVKGQMKRKAWGNIISHNKNDEPAKEEKVILTLI